MAKKRIVLIDDEKQIVQLLCIELESSGYDVTTAFDGESGLELIRKEKPDLVLLDLMMPKMDGFKVLEAMRRDNSIKDILAILLTAKNSVNDIERGLELGIEDYIIKPFNSELFIKRIGRMLS